MLTVRKESEVVREEFGAARGPVGGLRGACDVLELL
jgi:hypothetical protein